MDHFALYDVNKTILVESESAQDAWYSSRIEQHPLDDGVVQYVAQLNIT